MKSLEKRAETDEIVPKVTPESILKAEQAIII